MGPGRQGLCELTRESMSLCDIFPLNIPRPGLSVGTLSVLPLARSSQAGLEMQIRWAELDLDCNGLSETRSRGGHGPVPMSGR